MSHLLIVDDDTGTLASLSRAFRLAGYEATVCDNAGNAFLCTIRSLDKKTAFLAIENRSPAPPAKARLAIACAVPKFSAMDDIIDKLTQLRALPHYHLVKLFPCLRVKFFITKD